MPLYDAGATRAAVQAARSEEREARLRSAQYRTGIRAEIVAALLALGDAKERKSLADSAATDAAQAETIAQTRFAAGIGTRLELLDAQTTRTEAEVGAAGAGYDLFVARARLHRAVGE